MAAGLHGHGIGIAMALEWPWVCHGHGVGVAMELAWLQVCMVLGLVRPWSWDGHGVGTAIELLWPWGWYGHGAAWPQAPTYLIWEAQCSPDALLGSPEINQTKIFVFTVGICLCIIMH